MNSTAGNRSVICKISELQQHDRILSGSVLGPLTAAESLSVKAIEEGDYNKFAVTFFGLGTIFLHKDTLVEIIPARSSEDAEEAAAE